MMRTGTIAFLSGIMLLCRCHALPSTDLAVLFTPLALFLLTGRLLRPAACLLCGFTWALLCAHGNLVPELDRKLEGQTLVVTGRVTALPEAREDGVSFGFLIDQPVPFAGKNWQVPQKVRLTWYQKPPRVRPGQYWQLSIRLKRPHGFMNPGGFDYEGWLFQRHIRATGYVVNTPLNRYTGITRGAYTDRLRYRLREQINRHPGDRYRGLLIALALGDRSQTSLADRTTLISTGTYHLLAISGLHISLVAGLFYMVMVRLWSRTGRWSAIVPAPKIATAAAMLAATAYAVISGFAIPAQRALVMLAPVMYLVYSGRRYAVSQIICMALLLVLIIDPFAPLNPGFWLSFGAISVLAWGMNCRVSARSLWWRWGRAQYVVFAGLLPLSLLWFQQYALNGIPANIIAIPWISLITTPLALAGMALINLHDASGQLCLYLAGFSLHLLWPLLEWLGQWQFSMWHQAAPSFRTFAGGMAGVLILLLPAGISWRWVGAIWLLPLLLPIRNVPGEGEVWFTLLDVGQGLSAVVHTRTHTLVYDTGARFNEDFNAGSAVIVPYLRYSGTAQIDKLIISHGDNDHIGGAAGVLSAYPGTSVLAGVPAPFDYPLWSACHAGQKWQWDRVNFEILHPDDTAYGRENNQSCVLRINTAQYSILLPGDIEKEAEYHLLHKYNSGLAADILVAPHHGSKTSSTAAFLNAVRPRLVLFPVGYRNRFRFPNQDIMQRYELRGVRTYATDRDGAVMIRIDRSAMAVTTWRGAAGRFWHDKD